MILYARLVSGSIEIGGHRIGPGFPTFVIAEVGVNHNGNVALAYELIDAAASAGADAVKFQTFRPELLAATTARTTDYQRAGGSGSFQIDMLEGLSFDPATHAVLKDHCERLGVLFMSSPFDIPSLELLIALGVPAIKVPSGEITNLELVRRVAKSGLPVVMSTGMATMEEVSTAVQEFGDGSPSLALLHCVSNYPAAPESCNLRAMDDLRDTFGTPVGWSDHTSGIAVALAAVALGANIVEKHLTLDRTLAGPDHAASIEPEDLRAMIEAFRTIEVALGERHKRPVDSEASIAAVARKSLHWRRSLKPGDLIKPDDLIPLRPGTGLSPARLTQLVGLVVRVNTTAGEMVLVEDIAGPIGPPS